MIGHTLALFALSYALGLRKWRTLTQFTPLRLRFVVAFWLGWLDYISTWVVGLTYTGSELNTTRDVYVNGVSPPSCPPAGYVY